MQRRSTHVRIGLVLATAVVVASCGDPPRPVAVLADYVPIQRDSIATDVIYPALQEFDQFLGHGWEPLAEDRSVAQGRSIVDRWASFRFFAAVAGPLTLELDATTSIEPERPQTLTLRINDQRIDEATIKQGWNSYAFSVPVDALQTGWNRAELHFRRMPRPSDVKTAGADRPLPAASIRRLRLRPPLDRPVWTDRPAAIQVKQVKSEESGAGLVEMPADSLLDVYLELGADARLVGSVDAAFAEPDRPTELSAAVDVLDQAGESHTLFERTYRATPARNERFQISLDRWANVPVRVRLRTWGRSNGVVRWRDVTVEASGGHAEAQLSGHLLPPPGSGRLGRPHVILILLDAARADAFDGSRPDRRTPHVEALAAEGTRFAEAWAPSAWTGQTVPAVLTGCYPEATGSDDWGSQIPQSVPTLPELMSKGGYFPFLWSQHNVWRGNASLRRGFEKLRQLEPSVLANRELLPSAADLFVEGKPTFAFVHLLPPHNPYSPPLPFRGSLTAAYAGKFGSNGGRATNQDPADELTHTQAAGRHPTPEDISYVRARYDENVRYADHLVGRLVDTIRRAGEYDNTLILLLADHGDAFFEHGRFLHQDSVYQELVHVPLIVKWPVSLRGFARRVADPVSLVDIVPTLVDGLALPVEPAVFQGRTLLPLAFDKAPLARDLYASTRPNRTQEQQVRTLRLGRYKVIYDEKSAQTELYDLVSDPGENADLAAKEPLRTRALLQRLLLQRHRNSVALANAGGARREALDADTLRALQALGYVQ